MTTPASKPVWIGVDLAKASFDAAVAPEATAPTHWRRLSVARFDNTAQGQRAFAAWVQSQARGAHIERLVVESTGSLSRRFAEQIEPLKIAPVAIINPAHPRALGRSLGVRDKSDRIDAALLAVYGVTHRPPATETLSEDHRRLRDLSRLREDLVGARTAWSNRLGESLDAVASEVIEHHLASIKSRIAHIDQEIEVLIGSNQALTADRDLLTSIDGIGRVSAQTLLAEFGDLSQYTRGEITARAGQYPREHTSGTSVRRRPRLVRGGGQRVRRVLYMAALSIFRRSGPLGDHAKRLVDRGLSKMAAIGALMRKLLLIARAVIRSRRPYDSALVGTTKTA